MSNLELQEKAINCIRFLSADAVQQAKSGHPGLPMGAAAMAYTLWTRHLKFDPKDPHWPDRDRFVLSAGHGSALLYSMLHLSGYDLPLDELKRFRQLGSKTPGHPEYGETPGVETTTGPLGAGFAMGVGMALAAEHLAAQYNQPELPVVDHFIYAIVSDGDLMEGVASEAASFAGHQKLGRLIYLYDDNHITIDGPTDLAFTEDRVKRFDAYGWHTVVVPDGNDVEAIDQAIQAAKKDPRPSLIACRTHIGFGLPTKQDKSSAHGEPPGDEELAGAKQKLGWPTEPRFLVPDDVREHFRPAADRGQQAHSAWKQLMDRYAKAQPELSAQFARTQSSKLPDGLAKLLPAVAADPKGVATRAAYGKALNATAPALPELIGGSADLTPSNQTAIKDAGDFTPEARGNRYLRFGVREHAMGQILNGIRLHGGLIPYGGTFMVFADYMRPPIRLAALMGLPVIFIFTHDSIGVGEDGPTHQPVEHLASLRAIPNLVVLRPADANETNEAWLTALERREGPAALVLTRQALPTYDRTKYAPADGLRRGAYVMADLGKGKPSLILMASGSEVEMIVAAAEKLVEQGTAVRVVSFPSWELFESQPESYRKQVLPADVQARVAVEAGVSQGWERYVGDKGLVLGIDRFGASAPYKEVYKLVGLTVENVVAAAQKALAAAK
ncbi:MAG: transketolase [Anaerolineales bacterium]|nr:transketolase [Anaerolineales bacterium]